jgi:pimeloyl-ACP methyl ester carboxylesterase
MSDRISDRWLDVNGLRIHTRTSLTEAPPGSPSIAVIHGFGASGQYMEPLVHCLGAHGRVLAPDLPGCGLSDRPANALDVPGLADVLDRWLTAAGVERAIFVASSFGSQIVVDLAWRYPHRVERAVLIGPTVDPAARTARQQAWRLAKDVLREPPRLILMQTRAFLETGPRLMLPTLRYMLADRIEDKLPELEIPVLVVHGERDPVAPWPWIETAATLAPNGRAAAIAGGAHAVNYSHPHDLTAVLLPFLTDTPTPRR